MSKSQSKDQSSDSSAHGPWITSGGKRWCFSCGHVALNNDISRWATKIGCDYRDHPSYKQRMKKAGGR